MTLDDAINYYDGIAKECRANADIERNDYMDLKDNAAEAEQLASWLNELKLLRERIEKQPEQCEDAVSRQAAISIPLTPKGLRKYQTCNLDDAYDEGWGDYQACVSQLPSAQPEQRWIPCSERFPEEDDYKTCIECLDGAVWYFTENGTMGLGYYYKSTKEWSTTGDLKTDGKVIAWKPLPKPYREEGEG